MNAPPEQGSADDEKDECDDDCLPGNFDAEVTIWRRVMMQPSAVGLHSLSGHGSFERRLFFRLLLFFAIVIRALGLLCSVIRRGQPYLVYLAVVFSPVFQVDLALTGVPLFDHFSY